MSPPLLDLTAARPNGLAWQVRLLGALEATRGAQQLSRFPSRAVGLLLARLALRSDHEHAREELVDMLWPEVALEVGRNRLRQALSTLKSLLESEGGPPVLAADRRNVRVLPGALTCDVLSFEHAAQRGDRAGLSLYRGPLMPGHYEEWVLEERQRLAGLYEQLQQRVQQHSHESLHERSRPSSQEDLQAHRHPGWLDGGTAPTPAAPPTPALPSGLPSYWTRSIGTEHTATRLRGLIAAQRLVTVLGPGGSGKTRLAVEVATAWRDAPPMVPAREPAGHRFDRVAFVPLVDCTGAAQVLDAICVALGADGMGLAQQRIQAALSGERALLVLDNLEQLDVDAAQQIADLLRDLPTLHVLTTSRRLLDLDGEQAFELDGLALPAAEASLDAAATNPAVVLFVDRARAARADFHLTLRNHAAVIGLVRLLGGMPLAIELAASRVRVITPAELLQHLTQDAGSPMLDLLARHGQRSTAGSRHASMRHVVAWSWRQLNPEQAAALESLTVLHAPATAGAT